ncbi:phage holin family protein [Solilutibacter tolerans]|uniref:Putative Holin-X, holin superfamily III n=1 Tax=Solilutibacter tolerans TaxID=1604334 RepID=A0A1N6QHT5_9GAMM|nr:phage holin family protein [Lysobacter tolerans]SIQ16135.1 Putative Holin-X, holin superfamily III [Lysobacter tolerans]
MSDKRSAGDEVAELLESFRQVGSAGQAGLAGVRDATKAMRTLVAADVSLARSAFGRTLAFTAGAIVFGVVAGLMLSAALVMGLSYGLGMPVWASLLVWGTLCALTTWFAGWRAMRYFEHTRMKATRRQLARLGIGELSDHTPDPASPQSTKEATDAMPTKEANGAPVKDEQGINVTPP